MTIFHESLFYQGGSPSYLAYNEILRDHLTTSMLT